MAPFFGMLLVGRVLGIHNLFSKEVVDNTPKPNLGYPKKLEGEEEKMLGFISQKTWSKKVSRLY